jgi:DNA polymerase III delta prime subunit
MKLTKESFLWVEKYRPSTVSDCILPARLKKVFQEFVDQKSIPNLMLTGSAGVGKTTIAKAMCDEIGLNSMLLNSSDERGIAIMQNKIKNYASTISLTGGRKVIILDEADYLTPDAQAALRGMIELFAENCSFIFTCNFKARLIDALHSRCSVVDFNLTGGEKQDMALQFFNRAQGILKAENVEYDKKVLAELVQKYFPDYRRTLNELQRFSKFGAIDQNILAQVSDVRKMGDLIAALKSKDFGSMRKWVINNSDIDPASVYRKIYDGMNDYLKPESIPQAVVIIARYQYQAAFVADQEVNLVAALTELMVDCEYA